jgi:integrase
MVEFMAYTGLRAAEVSGLEVGDLVFAAGPRCSVNVRSTKDRKNCVWQTGTLKSRKSRRTVPLPPWLAERMADYLATDHPRANEPTVPLWPSRNNGGGYRAKGERYVVPLDWSQPLSGRDRGDDCANQCARLCRGQQCSTPTPCTPGWGLGYPPRTALPR